MDMHEVNMLYAKFEPLFKEKISYDLFTQIFSYMTKLEFKKGDFYVRPNDVADKVGLCSKGLFKLYYLDQNGREYIKSFNGEGFVMAPFAEILQSIPSRTYIQALCDSEVYELPYEKVLDLASRDSGAKELLMDILEMLYLEKEQKEFAFLKMSPFERYEAFRQQYAQYLDKIPQFSIASYLGITPEALSRILKRNNF